MSYYIYKICCDDCPEFIYVGSTKAFRQRKQEHKKSCNNENSKKYNLKLYTTIRANGGWNNWRMVIIEECDEISFTQARIKEEENRVKLNANLNMLKCHLTQEAKRESDNKYAKERRENNKEYFRQKDKEYYEKNKETILPKKREQSRIYYYKKHDEKLKYSSEYREKNKETINEKKKEKITCDCGKVFRKDGKAEHERSLFHQRFINDK